MVFDLMRAYSRKAHFTVLSELNIRIQLAGRKQLSVDRDTKSLIISATAEHGPRLANHNGKRQWKEPVKYKQIPHRACSSGGRRC